MESSAMLISSVSNLISVGDLANIILQLQDNDDQQLSVKDPLPENIKILDWTALKDSFEKFKEVRIPGSTFLDLNNKLIDPDGKYPSTYPTENIVRKRLGQLGVKIDHEIILYSQTDAIRFATRAWYILKSYGYSKVFVLSGGLPAWTASNYPTECGDTAAEIDSENTDILQDSSPFLIDYNTVKEIEGNTDEYIIIIDARSQAQYEGTTKPDLEGCKPGHIPNAVNIPATTLLEKNGNLKTPEELQEIFNKAMVNKSKTVISHCNNGTSATVILFALKEWGFSNVRLFDGSWSEYGSNL